MTLNRTVDQLIEEVEKLPLSEKERFIGLISSGTGTPNMDSQIQSSRRKWKGIYAGLGPVPSLEDIHEVRREALRAD
jgi:hypothetical protein